MGTKSYTLENAEQIKHLLKERTRVSADKQKGIRAQIRRLGFKISDYWTGFTDMDFDNEVKAGRIVINPKGLNISSHMVSDNALLFKDNVIGHNSRGANKLNRDEYYVIDICDEVLGQIASRQHKFDFLLGDRNNKGYAARLPVDCFYEKLNLVVEYREKQHTERIALFDKRNTVSGVSRGEQRRIYDERRRKVLPKYGITLVEISYSDFNFDDQKRIIRCKEHDFKVVMEKLNSFLGK